LFWRAECGASGVAFPDHESAKFVVDIHQYTGKKVGIISHYRQISRQIFATMSKM
jgi:hypothetical protein